MTKIKHTFRLEPQLSSHLIDYAGRKKVPQSQIVEHAIASFLSPDNPERMEAALTRRLDRQGHYLKQLGRDIEVSNEAIALFVHFWLSTTPALPPDQRDAARASGSKRYRDFVGALGNRLGSRNSFIGDISQALETEDQR